MPSTIPAGRSSSPARASSPASRTFCLAVAASWISTSPRPAPGRVRVRSCITTASAPGGIGAPVMIRTASRGPTARVG